MTPIAPMPTDRFIFGGGLFATAALGAAAAAGSEGALQMGIAAAILTAAKLISGAQDRNSAAVDRNTAAVQELAAAADEGARAVRGKRRRRKRIEAVG